MGDGKQDAGVPVDASKPTTLSPAITNPPRLSVAMFAPMRSWAEHEPYATDEEKKGQADATYFDPAGSGYLGKLLRHLWQKLSHPKGLEELWVSRDGYDGPIPAEPQSDKEHVADEAWARAVCEMFSYAPYGGPDVAYGRPDPYMVSRLNAGSYAAFPIIVACQQVSTYLAYTRRLGEMHFDEKTMHALGASSFAEIVTKSDLGGTYYPIGDEDADVKKTYLAQRAEHAKWDAARKAAEAQCKVFHDPEPHVDDGVLMVRIGKNDDLKIAANAIAKGMGPGGFYVFNNFGPEPPPGVPQAKAHVGSILRVIGNRFQTFDTGALCEDRANTSGDQATHDHGLYDHLVACNDETIPRTIGMGVLPKAAPGKLAEYVEGTLVKARPVGLVRLVVATRHWPTTDAHIRLVTKMLFMWSDDDAKLNFTVPRLMASLRGLPSSDRMVAYWVVFTPNLDRGKISKWLWEDGHRGKKPGDLPSKDADAYRIQMNIRSKSGSIGLWRVAGQKGARGATTDHTEDAVYKDPDTKMLDQTPVEQKDSGILGNFLWRKLLGMKTDQSIGVPDDAPAWFKGE